MAKRKVQKDK